MENRHNRQQTTTDEAHDDATADRPTTLSNHPIDRAINLNRNGTGRGMRPRSVRHGHAGWGAASKHSPNEAVTASDARCRCLLTSDLTTPRPCKLDVMHSHAQPPKPPPNPNSKHHRPIASLEARENGAGGAGGLRLLLRVRGRARGRKGEDWSAGRGMYVRGGVVWVISGTNERDDGRVFTSFLVCQVRNLLIEFPRSLTRSPLPHPTRAPPNKKISIHHPSTRHTHTHTHATCTAAPQEAKDAAPLGRRAL